MAVALNKTKLEPVGTSILEQLSDLDASSMSPGTAHKLLQMKFDPSHQERVDILSQRARDGSLIAAEQMELDEYIRVANLLAVLQSRARRALTHSGRSA
jgi:hypothetical protein